MRPMRTVSACACARVQSKLNAAAAAADVFSSVLREVGIVSLPLHYYFVRDWFLQFLGQVFGECGRKSTGGHLSCPVHGCRSHWPGWPRAARLPTKVYAVIAAAGAQPPYRSSKL